MRRQWSNAGMILVAASAVLVSCGAEMKAEPLSRLRPETIASPDRVAGEYIVTVHPGSDADVLRQLYSAYGVRDVVNIGANLFFIKLTRDPGVDEIRR